MIYCKLVIIRHVPMLAIFVSVRNDEITYWRIQIYIYHWLFDYFETKVLAFERLESSVAQ